METERNPAPRSNGATIKSLRKKMKKGQSLTFTSSAITKKKRPEPPASKAVKLSLKKKRKDLLKTISNQLDFNHYKKIFCSTFSKFDTNNSATKLNFHSFYTQVKANTKDPTLGDKKAKELDDGMLNFFKTGKENVNMKTLEKTQKVFESTMNLLEKDLDFLENFDVTKISNNVTDIKVKLDQSRKIVQKYGLNKEVYNATSNHKDESIDQLVFTKRLKMYESIKQDSNFNFDEIPYDFNFDHEDNENKEIEKITQEMQPESGSIVEFTNTASETLNQNMEVEEAFVGSIKESQLDHILKFNKKEDIDLFLKENKMTMENIHLDSIDLDHADQSLGWKVFKNLTLENHEGNNPTRNLEIMATKERFRTQRKNSDFFYYETSLKKATSIEPDSKKTPRDKAGSHKKKKPQPNKPKTNHVIYLSAEKASVEDKSDSDKQVSTFQISRRESCDPKSLKLAESLIEDYREILHSAFKNLSSKDPNFIRQAILHDDRLELPNLSKVTGLDDLFQVNRKGSVDDSLLSTTTHTQMDWVQPSKSIFSFGLPSSVPEGLLNIPKIISASPQLKALDHIPNLQIPIGPTGPFHPISLKGKAGDLIIPDLRTSPQLNSLKNGGSEASFLLDQIASNGDNKGGKNEGITGNFAKKNSVLDNIINSDDTTNMNYLNIFNAMDQGTEKGKNSLLFCMETVNDKSHKKNIILTRNNA